jgi:hypothetical protein
MPGRSGRHPVSKAPYALDDAASAFSRPQCIRRIELWLDHTPRRTLFRGHGDGLPPFNKALNAASRSVLLVAASTLSPAPSSSQRFERHCASGRRPRSWRSPESQIAASPSAFNCRGPSDASKASVLEDGSSGGSKKKKETLLQHSRLWPQLSIAPCGGKRVCRRGAGLAQFCMGLGCRLCVSSSLLSCVRSASASLTSCFASFSCVRLLRRQPSCLSRAGRQLRVRPLSAIFRVSSRFWRSVSSHCPLRFRGSASILRSGIAAVSIVSAWCCACPTFRQSGAGCGRCAWYASRSGQCASPSSHWKFLLIARLLRARRPCAGRSTACQRPWLRLRPLTTSAAFFVPLRQLFTRAASALAGPGP